MPIERVRFSRRDLTPASQRPRGIANEFYNDFMIDSGYPQAAGTKMYLEYISVNNSCHNFQAQDSFTYRWPSTTPETIIVDIGDALTPYRNYTVSQLNQLLQDTMLANSHVLLNAMATPVYYAEIILDSSTGKTAIRVNPLPTALPPGWTNPGAWTLPAVAAYPQLTFAAGSIVSNRLGHSGAVPSAPTPAFGVGVVRSTEWPNMEPYQIQSVRCNVAYDPRGGDRVGEIHSYDFAGVAFGSQLQQYRAEGPARFNVLAGSKIRVRLMTELGEEIPIRDPNVNIVLCFETP